jgi:hypothetical protein
MRIIIPSSMRNFCSIICETPLMAAARSTSSKKRQCQCLLRNLFWAFFKLWLILGHYSSTSSLRLLSSFLLSLFHGPFCTFSQPQSTFLSSTSIFRFHFFFLRIGTPKHLHRDTIKNKFYQNKPQSFWAEGNPLGVRKLLYVVCHDECHFWPRSPNLWSFRDYPGHKKRISVVYSKVSWREKTYRMFLNFLSNEI